MQIKYRDFQFGSPGIGFYGLFAAEILSNSYDVVCCQEFCPKGAMKVHRPLIAKVLNKL